jgi:hypothetical protein
VWRVSFWYKLDIEIKLTTANASQFGVIILAMRGWFSGQVAFPTHSRKRSWVKGIRLVLSSRNTDVHSIRWICYNDLVIHGRFYHANRAMCNISVFSKRNKDIQLPSAEICPGFRMVVIIFARMFSEIFYRYGGGDFLYDF